jgi:hypothetical protein
MAGKGGCALVLRQQLRRQHDPNPEASTGAFAQEQDRFGLNDNAQIETWRPKA